MKIVILLTELQLKNLKERIDVDDEDVNYTLSDVNNFFEKNPEFANKIYSIIDFNKDNRVKQYLNKLKDFKRVTGKKSVRLIDRETGESVSYNIDIINKKGKITYQLEELEKNKGNKISLEDSKLKDAGIYAYLDFFINNQDKDIVVGNILSGRGVSVLKKLESLGMVRSTNAPIEATISALKSRDKSDLNYFYIGSPFVYNRDFLKNLEKDRLTPKQKSQAQELYYDFLVMKKFKNIEVNFDRFIKFANPYYKEI